MSSKSDYLEFDLPNGLRVVAYYMGSVTSVFLDLYVRVGAVFEKPEERGLSHFVEHLAFKGTEKYPSAQAFSKHEQKIGSFLGAGTASSDTGYYIKIPDYNLGKGLELIYQAVFKTRLQEEGIKKEKEVIISEYNDFWQNPLRKFSHIAKGKRYKTMDHPYSYRPMGTPESVSKFTKNDLIKWKANYYNPTNMLLSIAGNFKAGSLKRDVETFFGKEPAGEKFNEPKFSTNDYSAFTLYHERDPRTQVVFQISFPAFGWKTVPRQKRLALNLLNQVLGGGPASRIYQRLREKEFAIYGMGSNIYLLPYMGELVIHGSVDIKKMVATIKAIREEIDKILAKGISRDELELAKNYMNSQTAMQFDNPEGVSRFLGRQAFSEEEVWFPEKYIKEVSTITQEQIILTANKIFDYRRVNISLLGSVPEKAIGEVKNIFK
jgi:predicted Zn-dependent peptidase